MLRQLTEKLAARVADAAEEQFGVRPKNQTAAVPPRHDLGDLAFSFPFEVAKRAGGIKPRDVAIALQPVMEAFPEVQRADVAGGGFLNVFLDREAFTRSLFVEIASRGPLASSLYDGKILIEHTNVNPNKAAHVGHVRNAVLGDTLGRLLRAMGHEVEVQNYIDDTGVQVADVVVGFLDIEKIGIEEVRAISEPFDYHCWDLYARVGAWYAEDESRKARRSEVLHLVESGGNATAELADFVARRVVTNHLATMARLGIRYDLLAWEGDIIRRGLWSKTFDSLKKTDAVFLADDGKNAGCWVMGLEGTAGFKGLEEADKVLVRSNGTATYVAKDIAYQLWKFGLSAVDFSYEERERLDDGTQLWTTTSADGAGGGPGFGSATRVYNVIDVRQSYLQDVVSSGLEALGYVEQAKNSIHYSYEMVALTPKCAADLGLELTERDRSRPYVEMSGRRGLGVKADDLLDRLTKRASAEVVNRHDDMDADAADALGKAIAIGAVRYFMLRFGRNKVVAFDLDEALRFQGETGPYLQNSVVRCYSIFRKLADSDDPKLASLARFADIASLDVEADLPELLDVVESDQAWELIYNLDRLEEAMTVAVQSLELSVLAKWAFQVAQRFHKYYEHFRIKGEESDSRRRERAAVVAIYAERMTRVLDVMGIPVPERM